jgi:hypothetical protein
MVASFVAADEKVTHVLISHRHSSLGSDDIANSWLRRLERGDQLPWKMFLINSFFVVFVLPGSSANSPPSSNGRMAAAFSLELSDRWTTIILKVF